MYYDYINLERTLGIFLAIMVGVSRAISVTVLRMISNKTNEFVATHYFLCSIALYSAIPMIISDGSSIKVFKIIILLILKIT